MSYDSASLTTPDIKWLGLRPSDLNKYDLPDQCRLDMTDKDIKTGQELLEEDFIKKNPEWMKELKIMVSDNFINVSATEFIHAYDRRARAKANSYSDFSVDISFLYFQVKTKKKAEIQALSSFGFQYITEEYLPRKLREGDWI